MKRNSVRVAFLSLVCVFGTPLAFADLYVIVNAGNTLETVSVEEINRIFLKKTKRFENGRNAEPVMLLEGSRGRALFNKKVLARDEQQLKYYWSRRMFSGGDRPPPSAASEADVVTVVAEKDGAIGYVTSRPKDTRVKVVFHVKE